MKNIAHLNSLTHVMNLYSYRNLPLLTTFLTSIAVVSDSCQCSTIITPPSMYSRGSAAAARRPKPYSGSTASTSAGTAGQRSSSARPSSARPAPHVNPKITQQGKTRMYEELRENTYRDRLCPMCSDSSTAIYHQHFSTTDIRRMFLEQATKDKTDKSKQTYMCPICSDLEPVLFPSTETRRVVLASSTMYSIWGKTMPPTPHISTSTPLWEARSET